MSTTNERRLTVAYTDTQGEAKTVHFGEHQHNWVSGVRVGARFAAPAQVAAPLLSAIDDIDSIENVTYLDENGVETDLPA